MLALLNSGVIGPQQTLILVVALIIFLLLIPLIVILDVLKSDFKGNDKTTWLLVAILLPILGAIFYFTIGRKQKINN